MKKNITILTVFFAITLMILIPNNVFAATNRTETLDLCTITKSEENLDEGWSYNYDTKTLTLTNANFSTGNNPSIKIPVSDDINLVLNGENTLTSRDIPIKREAKGNTRKNLIISGTGKLTLVATNDLVTMDVNGLIINSGTIVANNSIMAIEDIKVNNAKLNITTNSANWGDGIYSHGSIYLSNSTINIDCDYYGLYAFEDIYIESGTLNIDAGFYGITAEGAIYISGGNSKIYGRGGIGILACGITTKENGLSITGGNLTVNGTTIAIYVGLYKNATAYINNSTGIITIDDGVLGIYVKNGNLTIEDINHNFKENLEIYDVPNGKVTIALADYTKIDNLINSVPTDLENYVETSVTALNNEISKVDRTKNVLQKKDLQVYEESIQNAINNLVLKEADYSKVDELMNKVLNIPNNEDYKNFQVVVDAVNSVVRGKSIKEQEEVDKMAKVIEDAINNLELKEADYSKVDELIIKVQSIPDNYNYEDFQKVVDAVNSIVRGKSIKEQQEVDKMAENIENELKKLKLRNADYSKVNELIKDANSLNKEEYKNFSKVETAIKAVVTGKNIREQQEVDKMANDIEDAISSLELKDADYSKVNELIKEANSLNKEEYKDFSKIETAIKAVVTGKNIREQQEVDKMAKDIEDAISSLELKDADYSKVNELKNKVNSLNPAEYEDFSKVEEAVKKVVTGKNIREQQEVDKMAENIEIAIKNLKIKVDNPDTGDNIQNYMIMLITSCAGIIVTLIALKKVNRK